MNEYVIMVGFNPVCTKYRANPAYTCETQQSLYE